MSMRRRFVGLAVLSGCIALLAITSVVAQATANRRFVPISLNPPVGSITFGTAADANGIPSPATSDIPPSTRVLYFNARVEGGARGLPYRLEWTLNGQPLDIQFNGTVLDNPDNIAGSICFTRIEDEDCSNPTSTLRQGTYTLRLIVNDVQLTEATATVRSALDSVETDPQAQPTRGE